MLQRQWLRTPGAIDWLLELRELPKQKKTTRPSIPLSIVLANGVEESK